MVPLRPNSYYFVPSAESSERREKRKEYETVAIDGKDVILRARNTEWVGLAKSLTLSEI